jgi:hypothetical protein
MLQLPGYHGSAYFLLLFHTLCEVLSDRDSSAGITNRSGLDPSKARFCLHVYTGPKSYPASCTRSTGSFLGVKRLERGAEHPHPSSAILFPDIATVTAKCCQNVRACRSIIRFLQLHGNVSCVICSRRHQSTNMFRRLQHRPRNT